MVERVILTAACTTDSGNGRKILLRQIRAQFVSRRSPTINRGTSAANEEGR